MDMMDTKRLYLEVITTGYDVVRHYGQPIAELWIRSLGFESLYPSHQW